MSASYGKLCVFIHFINVAEGRSPREKKLSKNVQLRYFSNDQANSGCRLWETNHLLGSRPPFCDLLCFSLIDISRESYWLLLKEGLLIFVSPSIRSGTQSSISFVNAILMPS